MMTDDGLFFTFYLAHQLRCDARAVLAMPHKQVRGWYAYFERIQAEREIRGGR